MRTRNTTENKLKQESKISLLLRYYYVVVIMLILTGITNQYYAQNNQYTPKNCVFKPESNCIEKLRIYMDKDGNIYPPKNIHEIDGYSFCYPLGVKFKKRQCQHKSNTSLKIYFENQYEKLREVCTYFNADPSFDGMQNALLEAYKKQIDKQIKDGKKILFLIHGFNNFQEETFGAYSILKHYIGDRDDIAIIEVYWDGLAYNKNSIKIWRSAQRNSPFVGLGLRKLLNRVDKTANVTLLTHSLGASVATQVLFNVNKWGNNNFQKELDCLSNQISTPPQENITLAMLAPAIPGRNTFDDIEKYVNNDTYKHINKIVVGYNKKDKALIKYVNISRKIGSTSLGANSRKKEVNDVGRIISNVKDATIEYKSINLQNKPLPREHSIAEYMRAELFNVFLFEAIEQ